MKQDDSHNTDYQQGSVVFDLTLTKMANGQFKASCQDMEVSHWNSDKAVLELQDKLQAALLDGSLRPDM